MATCIVLVVEDNTEIRDLLVEILEEENLTVSGVRNGADALAFVEREAIDLIILDVLLPDVDGLSVIQQIRSRRSTSRILAMSGSPAALTMAQDHSVDAILAKPFDVDELLEVVTRLCPATGKKPRPSPTPA